MSKKNLAVLDTNLFIRFFTADHEQHYKHAAEIFAKIENNELLGIIPESVFAEIVFVLEKVYLVERKKIAELLGRILQLKGLRRTNVELFEKALQNYTSKSIDMVDCLILAYSEIDDLIILSFDRDVRN